MIRMRINSFKFFLNHLYIDKHYFSNDYGDENKPVSVRLDHLTPKYLDFCTKYGLKSKIIQENQNVLDHFGIELKHQENTETDAYVKIRWKTHFEKLKSKGIGFSNSKNKKEATRSVQNNIKAFIESECVKTNFESDFILKDELESRYEKY